MDRSKQILEQERGAAASRLASLQADFDGIVASASDANGDDEHDPEGATIAFERSRTASLLAETEATLVEIEAALNRLNAGTYGTCQGCAEAIGAERLEALPATTVCVRCAVGTAP